MRCSLNKFTKILTTLIVALLIVVGVLAVIGLFLPTRSHVERSVTIAAPQATVFALNNSFARFNEWSPWHEIDPDAGYEYEGPAIGVGARMSWQSDHPRVGKGSEEIVESVQYSTVRVVLDFAGQGQADSAMLLEQIPEGTRATWTIDTDLGTNIVSRYFGLMFDAMMGPSFERGLAKLKSTAESLPDADWSDIEITIRNLDPIQIAVVSGHAPQNDAAIGQALGEAYGAVAAFMGRNQLESAGMPLAITESWDDDEGWSFFAGIPIAEPPAKTPPSNARVRIGETPGGRTVVTQHVGPYAGLSASYAKAHAFAAAYGLEQAGPEWEQFVSDPGDTPENELITMLYIPIR